jgi:SAM-dependent methyltransferase
VSVTELADPRGVWNDRFARIRDRAARHGSRPQGNYEPWLERWLGLIRPVTGSAPLLDLGCGSGGDSSYLTTMGFRTIAVDISREALTLTACAGCLPPHTRLLEVDIRGGLPFRAGSLTAIVANLSLHYHRWEHTCTVFSEVHRCLQPGGLLLTRLNSTEDMLHGARGNLRIEHNCYEVGSILKRFFNRQDLDALFAAGQEWRVHNIEARTAHCYENPKALWEVVVEKLPVP